MADHAFPEPVDVAIDDIVIGKRHRKEMGDIARLASSIETEGLLQPIGITPDDELVFGERRIKAVQILGWNRIAALVVDVSSIAAGEFDENVIRKDFTTMERVAIGKTIEAEMGERRGGDQKSDEAKEIKRDSGPTCSDVDRTRDTVAQNVGFGSGREYDRAKAVAKKGSKPLQDAVDAGAIPVSSAAKLVDLPKAEQTRIAKSQNPSAEARKAVAPVKPTKDYARLWGDKLTEISERMDSVVEQYGSLANALDAWGSADTYYAISMLHELKVLLDRFDKEAQDYAKAKGLEESE